VNDARQSLRLVRPRATAQGKLPPPPPPSILPVYEQFKVSGLTAVFREFQKQQEEHNRRMAAWFAQQQQAEVAASATTTEQDGGSTSATTGPTLLEVQALVSAAVNSAIVESTRAISGVAALRAITLHPNHAVRYLSYLNTPGDGMGGSFIFNASESTTDDSVDYIRPVDVRSTNPGRWVRTVNP
jgi:hypothetical protein